MRYLATLSAAILSLGLLPAQEKPAAEPWESAIIHVKTLDGDSFTRLVRMLKVFGANTEADDHLRTIVVYGRPDVIAQMRHVVGELDRPGSEAALGRNLEMTLTFLRCSTKASMSAQPLPPDIEAAARQLRSIMQYKDVELWDVLPLHLQEGKDTSETLQLPRTDPSSDGPPPTASIGIRPESIYRKDQTRYVRLTTLNISMRIPYRSAPSAWSFADISLRTAGDFAEGQKTILGKLSGVEDGSAIFVIVTVKVLD